MKKIGLIIAGLAIVVAVTAYMNAGDREDRLAAQREAVIFLKAAGEEVATITFDAIESLESHVFTATLKSTERGPSEHTYTGVELRGLLQAADLDPDDWEQVVARAADGYTVALGMEEVLTPGNVYVVYLRDDEPLQTREDGGSGPYQVVIREDTFGQRWVKYLMEIDLR